MNDDIVFKPGVLTVYESDGFPAAAALLAYIAQEVTDQHDPAKLGKAEHAFVHGLWAAVGILIDPPTAGAGVIDFSAYVQRGFSRCMDGKR